jgi:mannose-6-phosphate isomerase-like protein (cupin superfamily)
MTKRRVECGRLEKVRTRRFGALEVQELLGKQGRPFSVLRIRMKPGSRAPELYHARTSEFFLVLKGSSSGMVGGRRRVFRAGDFVYLPPGTIHEFRAGPRGVELLDVFCPRLRLSRPDIVFPKGGGFGR